LTLPVSSTVPLALLDITRRKQANRLARSQSPLEQSLAKLRQTQDS